MKYSAPHLHEHDRNHLRRSGFTSMDLFSPSVLNNVETKYECSHSPKRQKMDSKPIFNSRKGRSDYSASSFPNTSSKVVFVANRIVSHNTSPQCLTEEIVMEEENDYIKEMDLSPGGRLQLFYEVWLANECHPRVARILKHGYEIILESPIELP